MSDFRIDLQYSLTERDNELFDDFYRRIFPGIERIELCEDMERQKAGIDKVIYFKSGNSFTIDEKKRRTDYGDIALELWSDYDNKKRGWLYYSQCDYIVYAVMPARKVYILPVILLKRAWYVNRKEWNQKYKKMFAQNERYRTQNICIPTEILLSEISKQMEQKICTAY